MLVHYYLYQKVTQALFELTPDALNALYIKKNHEEVGFQKKSQ